MKKEEAVKHISWTIEQAGIFCWALLLVMMILSSLVPGGGRSSEIMNLDKIFHFATNCAATMLPLIFIYRRRPAIILAALIPVLGFGLEYMQRGISGRTFSPEDLIANNLGVIVGVLAGCSFRLYRRFKRKGEKK
jgi:VanZ family protein